MPVSDADAQRHYYAKTACRYDAMHVEEGDEHYLALDWLSNLIDQHQFTSILDIGSGTGRVLLYLKQRHQIRFVGVEPVAELRAKGIEKGLSHYELADGDALNLIYPDRSFDLVCAFGVLHHIKDHAQAVREMCRVGRRAVFISDSNNFGQGGRFTRLIKGAIDVVGLWSIYDWVATQGKGYHYSEGDGIFYSYSLFKDLPVICAEFPLLRFMSTMPSAGPNLYRDAPHLAVFATR